MNIFESLENLNVSEKCFEDIIKLVEEYVTTSGPEFEPAKYKNKWSVYSKTSCTYEPVKGGRRGAEKRCKELNAICTDKPRIDLSYESLQLLEDIIDTIHKNYKYGAPEYGENGGCDLEDKAREVSDKEYKQAQEREGKEKVYQKRTKTKNKVGDLKTQMRHLQQWYKATQY